MAAFDMRPYFSNEMHDIRQMLEMRAALIRHKRSQGLDIESDLDALCDLSQRADAASAAWQGSPEQLAGFSAMSEQNRHAPN